MSQYTKLKNACIESGITGIAFASPHDVESRVVAAVSHVMTLDEEYRVVASMTSVDEVVAYINLVLAEDAGSAPEKAARKAESLVDKAGLSIADGGAVFAAVLGVLKGLVKKCNNQLNKIPKDGQRKAAKIAAVVAAVGIALAVITKIVGFFDERLKNLKKDGLKKKEAQTQKRLDKIKAELAKLEDCKKQAEALK